MRRMGRVMGAVVLTVGLAGAGWAVFPRRAAADSVSDATYFELAINQLRAAHGVGPLEVDPRLVPVAQGWSNAMAAAGHLSHNPALSTEAPSDWTWLGENVGEGGNVAGLQQAFTASPEHYANMVNPHYNAFAVAVTPGPGGILWVTEDYEQSSSLPAGAAPPAPAPQPRPLNAHPTEGYRLVASDGGVFAFGTAPFRGSAAGLHLAAPMVGMASTPDGGGYWLVSADGGVFGFGDASFHGAVGPSGPSAPIVGMAPTHDGGGYWLAGRDGRVYPFGDARALGSLAGHPLGAPVVAIAATPDGGGYWLASADGGVFSFGDASFHGSGAGHALAAPVVGLAPTRSGRGYWLIGADGGVFSFGDAEFDGSAGGLPLAALVRGGGAS